MTIDVRIVGSANLSQMKAQFAAVEAQVASLNTQMAAMVGPRGGLNPAGWDRANRAIAQNSQVMRAAANSSGMWEASQMRVTSATDDYIKRLERQKLTLRDVFRDEGRVRKAAYREQLRLQNMAVRELPGRDASGRKMYDLYVPAEVHKSWDTLGQRVSFAAHELKSAGVQMTNWGKNTQWAGRQMMMGFTLPLVAFGAAAGVLAYQVDKQMTRIQKVYDTTANLNSKSLEEVKRAEKELMEVREQGWRTAEEASRMYGAAATDTLEVQAELAAQGKTGNALQESTNQVMRIATLGEFEHADALKTVTALTAIMGQTTKEVADSLNYMNAIENATSLQTEDFAKAIPIALGPLKEMGGDVQDLALLLVAMKERGIEAGEGANAIKSMMQRLYRPSKQIRMEWQELVGVDIGAEMDAAGGDVMKFLPRLNELMEGLKQADRVQLLGGLFGTYQVARQNAILKGLENINNAAGQTNAVMQVNAQGVEVWADTAERELKRIQDSASGQFKIALESIKNELTAMGEPFLRAATFVINRILDIVNVLENLPDPVKTFGKYAVIFMAIVGPLIMLTGLFVNFLGMMTRFGASSLLLIKNFGILNKETSASALATQLASKGYLSAGNAANFMAANIAKLAEAQIMANAAMGIPAAAGNFTNTPPPTNQSRIQGRFAQTVPTGINLLPVVAPADKIEQSTKNMNKYLKSASVSAGIMGAAMAASMVNSNKTVDQILKLAIIGSMVVPAVHLVSTGFKLIGERVSEARAKSVEMRREHTAMASATDKNAKGMARVGAATSKVGRNIKGAAFALNSMIGPLGWISLAVLGVGAGILAWADHLSDVREEQIKNQQALTNATAAWAEETGKVLRDYEKIALVSSLPGQDPSSFSQSLAYYETDAGKSTLEGFKAGGDDEEMPFAVNQFIDLQNRLGLSAAEAAQEIKALYVAAGRSMTEADTVAQDLLNTYGKFDFTDYYGQLDAATELIDMSNKDTITNTARRFGEIWAEAFNQAKTPEQVEELIGKVSNISEQGFEVLIKKFNAQQQGAIRDMGINTIEELYQAMIDHKIDFGGLVDIDQPEMTELITNWRLITYEIANTAGEAGGLGNEIESMNELLQHGAFLVKTMTFTEQKRAAEGMLAAQKNFNGSVADLIPGMNDVVEQTRLQLVRQMLLNAGLKDATNLEDAVYNLMHNIKEETGDAADEANRLASGYRKAFSEIDWKGTAKGVMTDVQDELGDIAMDNFQNRMDDALDAYEESQQARIDAMQNSHEAAKNKMEARQEAETRRFDKHWERRTEAVENAYDKRVKGLEGEIKAIEKAEDIRKKIFEAEKTRIQRLNDMRNMGIDFNVAFKEGDLDEAAKIQNDMIANRDTWAIEDAEAALEGRTEKEKERLQSQIDKVEELKETRLDAIKDIEEKERRALERMHDRQTRALERRQEAQQKALQREVENNVDAQREIWENRKRNVDRAIELFRAYVPKNEADLKRHIARIAKEYGGFNVETRGKFNKTSVDIGDMLFKQTDIATRRIRSDIDWEAMGESSSKKMLRGALDMTWSQFRNWMTSGNWPTGSSPSPLSGEDAGKGARANDPSRHTGGWVDGSPGSRAGVARGTKGLGPRERMMRLRDDEFVVPAEAAKKNAHILEQMRLGANIGSRTGGEPLGFAGIMGGIARGVMNSAITTGIREGHNAQVQKWQMAQVASYFGDFQGERSYNVGPVKPWVQEAANYLGSKFGVGVIGGYRADAVDPNGHPAGLALDLMTTSFAQGDAIAEEVRRLQGPLDADYMIWRQRIDSLGSRGGWRPMEDRGSPTANHMDHVHVNFFANGDVGDLPQLAGQSGLGGGSYHYAADRGKGWSTSHDYLNGKQSPLYAIADGIVSLKTYGPNEGSGQAPNAWPRGYGSYGVLATLRPDNGPEVKYAHLWPGTVRTGRVKGGEQIAQSAATGNAYGYHTHFEVGGSTDARGQFASMGIPLAKGAMNINVPELPAILHKNEAVLTEDINKDFREGVENFAEFKPKQFIEMLKKDPYANPNRGGKPDKNVDPVTGKAMSVRTGTYNLFRKAPNARTEADLARLMQMSDILSLTEYIGAKRKLGDFLRSKGWGVHTPGGSDDTAIAYDKKDFDFIKGGARMLSNSGGSGAFRDRSAAYARLRDKETGREFWQIAAHTVGHAQRGNPGWEAKMREQYAGIRSLVADLKTSGIPIFLAGDFNTNSKRTNLKLDFGLDAMAGIGLDRIFAYMAKSNGSKRISGLSSDHDAILSTLNIPGLAKGGNIRWNNTLANLHKNETVLTSDLSKQLHDGISNFANGGGNTYNVNVDARGLDINEDQLASKIVLKIKREESRKPQGTVGN